MYICTSSVADLCKNMKQKSDYLNGELFFKKLKMLIILRAFCLICIHNETGAVINNQNVNVLYIIVAQRDPNTYYKNSIQ